MKTIPLTKGKVALVDDEDFEELSKTKWCYLSTGYAHRKYGPKKKQTTVLMHRQIVNAPKGNVVDHINGNPLDNRRLNLRVVTMVENGQNRSVLNRNNTTGVAGVWFHKQCRKWCAEIMVRRKKISLGLFLTIEDAADARAEATRVYFGEFAHEKTVSI